MAKNFTRSWQAAINDKISSEMVMNKLKRDLFINKLMEEKDWIGTGETVTTPSGPRNSKVISFLGSEVSATKIGGFQAIDKIQILDPIRGLVESYVDMTGSMRVRERDLKQHKGKKLLVSLLGKFDRQTSMAMSGFKQQIEDGILNASVISSVTSIDDVATGILVLSSPEKVGIGMGVQLAGSDATSKGGEFFITAVDKNSGATTFSATLGGTAADLTNYVASTAALTSVCVNGSVSSSTGLVAYGFDSLESMLLSYANGGSQTYLTKTKTSYPFLQAYNKDGSSLTASDFLPLLFEYYSTEISLKTKHPEGIKPQDVMLSPYNFSIAMINLERYKGQFYRNDEAKQNPYGWSSVVIGSKGNGGEMRLNRVENLKNSIIPVVNMDTFALCSDGGLEFVKDPNNPSNDKYWHVDRSTTAATGYTFVSDYVYPAQFVCGNLESNAIIHSVAMTL